MSGRLLKNGLLSAQGTDKHHKNAKKKTPTSPDWSHSTCQHPGESQLLCWGLYHTSRCLSDTRCITAQQLSFALYYKGTGEDTATNSPPEPCTMQETLAFRVSPKDTQSNNHQETVSRLNTAQEQFHSSRGHNNSLANMFKVSWSLFGEFSEILIKQWLPWSISNYSTTHEYCWKSEKQIHRKRSRASWDSNPRPSEY